MGRLIVIEGLDGSGKSTQLSLMCDYLTAAGADFREISFPDYSDPSSTLVRMYLAGEFGQNVSDVGAYAASVFYAADRFASYTRHWRQDYLSGRLILAGRYATSNAIHQMAKLPEEQWDEYLRWTDDFEYVKLKLPRPDLVLYLDMPPELSQRLLLKRYQGDASRKDIHERDLDYQAACRRAAAYAAKRQGWVTVNTARDGELKTPEELHLELRQQIQPCL